LTGEFTKTRQFNGLKEANAHNTICENLTSHVKSEEMQSALRAAGLETSLPYNGVTLYSLHHKAVINQNNR